MLISFGSADAQLTRPTPMGVDGSNSVLAFATTGPAGCSNINGTLGAIVSDQSGTQYILSAAHVLALGKTGILATGSLQPVTQPALLHAVTECNQVTPALIASIQVARLSTVVPLNFTGSFSQADAAIAQVLPGTVSSSIVGIPTFSGVQLTVVKAGLQLQKSGAKTGNTIGHVKKINIPVHYPTCRHQPTGKALTAATCGLHEIKIANVIEVKPTNFGINGDSGSLVLTVGSCPQPVGLLIAKNSNVAFVEPIGPTMSALMSAGGYSSLSVVQGGGGCTPTTSQVQNFGDDNSADFTLQDATIPDQDVAQALSAAPNLQMFLDDFCALFQGVNIDGVGVDLSVSPAALDVVVDSAASLDPFHQCIPASFGGVPVEQDVIETADGPSGTFLPN
jgi:hypothetical protein